LTLEVFEDGVPSRWRLRAENGPLPGADAVTVETVRPDGTSQAFGFAARDGYLESQDEIPEPHAFTARVRLDSGAGPEVHDVAVVDHDHDHSHGVMNLGDEDDVHARAHAEDIRRRFQGRTVTTGRLCCLA
jgi:nickel/cobalt exporter